MSFMFESLVRAGGPKRVLEKWNTDVAEHRKMALHSLRYLLETDLVINRFTRKMIFLWRLDVIVKKSAKI
jgi:hypothetical protein